MEYRIAKGLLGLVLLGVVAFFVAFPKLKPDWIQLESGRGPRARNAFFSPDTFVSDSRYEACLERAEDHVLHEQWDEAIKDLNEAIGLQPRDAAAYLLRSFVWLSKNELDKAVSDLDVALGLAPDDAEAYYARAEIKSEQGQSAAAIADMDAVIRLTPDDPEAWISRGSLREDARDYPGALADYQEAVRLDGEDPEALNSLAWVLCTAPDARLRDGARALKTATQVVELDGGNDWNTLDTLAAACAENRNFPAALRYQSHALRLAPPEEHNDLQSRLDLYKAQRPYRLPVADK